MRPVHFAFLCVTCVTVLACAGFDADEISARARKLQASAIVLDTHDDTTQRFFSKDFDLGKSNPDGSIDIPRMREGGMNAIFFSIWIDGPRNMSDEMILSAGGQGRPDSGLT